MSNPRIAEPLVLVLPLRIVSEANKREHWRYRQRRSKACRSAAVAVPTGIPVPCVIHLTRIAPRRLDDDNLQSGFKALRDGIADRLGVKDNDPRVIWSYDQERGKPHEYAARITITRAQE